VTGCDDALALALRVGWPAEHLAHLGRIMWRESACKDWAYNPTDTAGGSWGLLQINGAHLKRTAWNPRGWLQSQNIGINTADDLFNAELNLRAGWALFQYAEDNYGDGWQPWAATRDRD
jgi:soluble lytic murein transglycosylase-like protein